jgi:hypothetical protein
MIQVHRIALDILPIQYSQHDRHQIISMKTFSSAVLLLAGLATASPMRQEARQTAGPYEITNFSASKVHLSGFCK